MNDHDGSLALVNGVIYTLEPAQPRVSAVLAEGGRVRLLGDDATVRAAAARSGCRVLDLAGACVLPGFTDSHIHFLAYGLNLEQVALTGVTSLQLVRERVGAAARQAAPGEWIQGWGWDHSLWEVPRFPDRSLLDDIVPHVPVFLSRKDGHMSWLNSAALAAAGITRETSDPDGGRIGRDDHGEPNGLLFERANALATQAAPPPTPDQADRAALRAMRSLHQFGVTGVHIPEGRLTFQTMQRLDARRALTLRTSVMLTFQHLDAAIATGLPTGFGNDYLRVGAVKLFADGSLGSETAAMLEPFAGSGMAENTGILTLEPDVIHDGIRRAARAGIACAIHAIGDRANRLVLDAFEATAPEWQPTGLRQRIEHVQILHPDDIARFARLGVVASVQPIHSTQDMKLVDQLWGTRGRYAYAFRSLLDRGARLAFGSDAPVETPDPLAGLYAAVTRRRANGDPEGGWYPQERLTLAESVAAYTTGAAYAAGQEAEAGSLSPGKWADFVVLSHDIMASDPESLLSTRVLHTGTAGRLVYSAVQG